MSWYLARTLLTTRNQIWTKQFVERREGETWRVLEKLGCSWEGSSPQREIEIGYFWACPAVPTLTYNHASSTPFTISGHPSQSAAAGPGCTDPLQDYWIHSLKLSTDGWVMWGGWEPLQRKLQKKMAALVSLGCNFERCERAQSAGGWATMVWTVCNGISMLR